MSQRSPRVPSWIAKKQDCICLAVYAEIRHICAPSHEAPTAIFFKSILHLVHLQDQLQASSLFSSSQIPSSICMSYRALNMYDRHEKWHASSQWTICTPTFKRHHLNRNRKLNYLCYIMEKHRILVIIEKKSILFSSKLQNQRHT